MCWRNRPASRTFTKAGVAHSGSYFKVNVDPQDCVWELTNTSADTTWVHIDSELTLTGNSTVLFSVDANTAPGAKARTGTIKAALSAAGANKAKTFTVIQAK